MQTNSVQFNHVLLKSVTDRFDVEGYCLRDFCRSKKYPPPGMGTPAPIPTHMPPPIYNVPPPGPMPPPRAMAPPMAPPPQSEPTVATTFRSTSDIWENSWGVQNRTEILAGEYAQTIG